jgi:hypothetical protein
MSPMIWVILAGLLIVLGAGIFTQGGTSWARCSAPPASSS